METSLTITFQQMLENPEISPPEMIFVDTYTNTLNKTQSMRKAFPDLPKEQYYDKANQLLTKPAIKQLVSEAIQKNLDGDVSRTPAMLLKYIEGTLGLEMSDFYKPDGEAIPLDEIDPDKLSYVINVDAVVNNKSGLFRTKYVLPNKEKAVDRLIDIVKLLTESRKVVGNEFADEATEAARMRDQIFNEDNARNVTEDVPKPTGKGSGRGRKMWTEEQKEEARRKWREKHGNKENSVDDAKEE